MDYRDETESNPPYPHNAKRERLRAEGNLNYLDFIRLVKEMWSELHPDIPIFPTQGPQYAKYPCIVYGLQMRRTHTDEPKKRYREEKVISDTESTLIYGQRFQNIIKFTVITKSDPYLAESIIEIFEDFMDKYTPVFKRCGVSEFLYARREPDDEGTSAGKDTSMRTVSYLVTIEKIHKMDIDRINEVVVSARIYLAKMGDEFTVTSPDQVLTMPAHTYYTGDIVEVRIPSIHQGGSLPGGLEDSWVYYVGETTTDTIQLLTISENPVTLTGSGRGRLVLVRSLGDYYSHTIEDLNQATPPH